MIPEVVKRITEHTKKVAERISNKKIDKIKRVIENSNSILVTGSGRSKLIGEAFAMRLAQLKLDVHVVGDVTTTAIKEGDCLIIISSSGDTKSVVSEAKKSKKAGAKIIVATANRKSEIVKLADVFIDMGPWRDYKKAVKEGREDNLTPLGTIYEDSTLLILDGIVAELMKNLGKTEKDLAREHFQ